MIERLDNHFIICGYGRVGRRAAEEMVASGEPFVVLDVNPAAIDVARERGVLHIEGSGTEDENLTRAGIDRARGLIASADSDSENVYITLSAHNAATRSDGSWRARPRARPRRSSALRAPSVWCVRTRPQASRWRSSR